MISLLTLPPATHAFILIAARLFFMMQAAPGWGEQVVPRRIRLLISLAVGALVSSALPNVPQHLTLITLLEACVSGLFLGLVLRLVFESLVIAGSIVGQQHALGGAFHLDSGGNQRDLFSAFVRAYFLLLFFGGEGHLVLFQIFVKSHLAWPLGSWKAFSFLPGVADFLVNGFKAALSMAMPFILVGLFYMCILGILNRLVPVIPAFFIMRPLDTLIATILLISCLPAMRRVALLVLNNFAAVLD